MLSIIFALALGAQPAEPSAPPTTPAAVAETKKQRRARERRAAAARPDCREIVPTGTNLPQTVCLTPAQWTKIRDEALESAQVIRDAAPDGFPRGR